uniref:Ion transport domain-containing protein n=1 Tax=Hanusia phi TaxID=3032 RepID=A0A6T7QSN2_9CRYP|mmetsp:Transcript_26144/g.59253  ORF Transcript_26144/g.59253 Transcript_26144/m.59253 type:complete len:411 (+) Transcript_26144:313-1545(+)
MEREESLLSFSIQTSPAAPLHLIICRSLCLNPHCRSSHLLSLLLLLLVYGDPSVAQGSLSFNMTDWEIGNSLLASGNRYDSRFPLLFDPFSKAPALRVIIQVVGILQMIATFLSTAIYFIFFWPSKFAETLDGLRRKQEQQEQNKKKTSLQMLEITPSAFLSLILMDFAAFYHLLLCFFAAMGAFYSPLFLPAQLVDFCSTKTGRFFLRAFLSASAHLVGAFLLALLLLLLFSLFFFSYFSQLSWSGRPRCQSLWQCTSIWILSGFSYGREMFAEDLSVFPDTSSSFDSRSWDQFRSLFLLLFIVLFGIILQGFINGVIYDSISRNRNQDEAQAHALRCETWPLLACQSLRGRAEEEAAVDDLAYVMHVLEKPTEETDHPELHVKRRLLLGDAQFLPMLLPGEMQVKEQR